MYRVVKPPPRPGAAHAVQQPVQLGRRELAVVAMFGHDRPDLSGNQFRRRQRCLCCRVTSCSLAWAARARPADRTWLEEDHARVFARG
jgi:hypothetical protein